MFNLLKMDLRRLFRTRSFYIVLAATAALIVLMVAMVSAASDPEKLDALQNTGMVVTDGSSEQLREELQGMTQLDFIHECLGSGFLLMIICIGVTLFVHSDFSSGYIKNICFVRPRRLDYVLSKILVAGVYSGILTILGVLVAALLQNLCQRFGWYNFSQYLLSMVAGYQCVPMLGTGQMAMILGCSLGWAALYAAGSFLAMEKRDI